MGRTEAIIVSVVIINSRGVAHPDWVQTALNSVKKQTLEVELIVIPNTDRAKTIGECWNEGVRQAKYDYVLFLGDDDWLSETYCSELIQYALNHPEYVMWTTNMTVYNEGQKLYLPLQRMCTGMWRKDYLLKYPFNEKLEKGIDREYIEEMKKEGSRGYVLNHNYGYFYRKHNDYSCAGKITFTKDKSQIYVLASYRSFIDPLVKEWRKGKTVFVSSEEFDPTLADSAEVIFCEFLSENAIKVANYECSAEKYLRLHSYEAFNHLIHYIDFKKFNKVIFIAKHIKDFVESKVGKLDNAVVIPVGIDLDKFDYHFKTRNNKIAYAGEISRKKGIGELLLLAKELPEYEFHLAGKFNEEDVARHFNLNLPDNVFIEPYSYDLPEFFKDKTYFINTSLREGNPVTVLEAMASGLKPLIRDWVGAEEIYGGYVYKDLSQLKNLLKGTYEPEIYREFVERHFNFENTYEEIQELWQHSKLELKTSLAQ